jgi:pimeloyl-ACP methyl ester carboxylesterase
MGRVTTTPVLLVRTALDAGELLPLGEHLAAAGLRPVDCPRPSLGSMQGDAHAVAEQLGDLAHGPVDVLGASYSSAVALTLAAQRPDLVRSLVVVEPPPAGTAYDAEFRDLCQELVDDRRERGTAAALDDFMAMLVGAGWRSDQEAVREGSVAQVEEGAELFFEAELPSLLGWSFGDDEAARVACPTLVVQGSETGPRFAAMAKRVADVVPGARLAVVPGAGHLAAATHPAEVAALVADLLRRTT